MIFMATATVVYKQSLYGGQTTGWEQVVIVQHSCRQVVNGSVCSAVTLKLTDFYAAVAWGLIITVLMVLANPRDITQVLTWSKDWGLGIRPYRMSGDNQKQTRWFRGLYYSCAIGS